MTVKLLVSMGLLLLSGAIGAAVHTYLGRKEQKERRRGATS
jgi:hypothetical protein